MTMRGEEHAKMGRFLYDWNLSYDDVVLTTSQQQRTQSTYILITGTTQQ
jgi:hypothetical protein